MSAEVIAASDLLRSRLGLAALLTGLVAIGALTITLARVMPGAHSHGGISQAAFYASLIGSAAVLVMAHLLRRAYMECRLALAKMTALSSTDELTGMSNRRRLVEDLQRGFDEHRPGAPARVFAFYDLNGFKRYNDTFGHPTGDELLRKLGLALQRAVADDGHAYRLGGDEFCVLLASEDPDDELIERCREALGTSGPGFQISAAGGAVRFPDEAPDVCAVLRIADQRMYRNKAAGRPSHAQQARDVLLRALFERSIDLGEHNDEVAALARACARRLGLPPDEVHEVGCAAELHDVGKVAIPDSILLKPGPLDEHEWAHMRTHTLAGQRILAAAPELVDIGRIVRSSHERWDGGGYPDGLSGSTIPLGARIVAACDAYDAMVSDRPYRRSVAPAAAIAELRACSGTQFDPQVIDALCEILDARAGGEAAAA